VGSMFVAIGLVPIVRFLILYALAGGEGHVQSLVLGSVSLIIGMLTFMIGLVAELTAFNRQLLVIILQKLRQIEYGPQQSDESHNIAGSQSPLHSCLREGNSAKIEENSKVTNLDIQMPGPPDVWVYNKKKQR
jgi:hypothetical protein